jgi:hypothetical protein
VNGLTRRAGIAAVAASVAWAFQSLVSIALPDPTAVLDVTMIVPMTLTLLAIWRLHQQGAVGNGKLARFGLGLGAIASITTIPGQFAFAFDWGTPGDILKVAIMVAFIGVLLVTGIAVLRARFLPRWVGAALLAAQPLAVLFGILFSPISPLTNSGDYTGALGHGIVWGLIGAAMLGKRIPLLNEPAGPMIAAAKP